jgi:hypothetical protein
LHSSHEIEWISPTAFDHLTRLERFDFVCFKYTLTQPLEIGIAPRFLKVDGAKQFRLLGDEKSVSDIETIELTQFHTFKS